MQKILARILVRARKVHSGNFLGQVNLTWVFGHWVALVRSAGLYSGSKDMVSIFFLFLKRLKDVSREAFGAVPMERVPQLSGAPREWQRTTTKLTSIARHSSTIGLGPIQETFQNLANLIAHSSNNPNDATVTIIIPAYNKVVEVAVCIESIFTFPSVTQYKIIIADDASPNFNFSIFESLRGIHVLRQDSNCGYINNVNCAAQLVTTPYLVTLNQDTICCPGWLDEMVNEMNRDPLNAIVGPRILGDDLLLLEAGGLIFQDGGAAHRGRTFLADTPRFAYSCNVDYVSGCALLIRAELWNSLGGLDIRYSPAYYDDVDLCLRVHALGLRVRYAPLACVIHLEGTSMGTDLSNSNSLKNFQVVNQTKLASIHKVALSTHTDIIDSQRLDSHFSDGTPIVCIFGEMPNPSAAGGSVDFDLIIQYLMELKYRVSVLFTSSNPASATLSWRALGILCEQFDEPFAKQLINESQIVFSFGITVANKLCNENFTHKHWIHHTSDVCTRRLELMNQTNATQLNQSVEAYRWYLDFPRDQDQMWELEKPTLEKPTTVLFVTEFDLQFVRERGAVGNFVHFPILKGGPNFAEIPKPLTSLTVGFVGGFGHSPNSDAVDYFLREMWPHITDRMPGTRFLIWGSDISVRQFDEWSLVPNVEVRGWFETWEDVVAQTRVFVSPLRFGAGMKHKVLSTLVNGRPIVGTSISFEGFDLSHLSNQVMSDDPTQIVSSIIDCLHSDEVCTEYLRQGLAGMGSNFSRRAEIERLLIVLSVDSTL